jgi:3',5'-cyclic AMP phosphodiesterase CpdA
VFFTFEAPFVRIVTLYSNSLEDPGVIADANIGTSQLDFLKAALTRVKKERFKGALILADHHPPYTAGGQHGWSVEMLAQIDQVCRDTGVWPHAFLSGHAHNYQRFTRTLSGGKQIPYIVCGNGGHNYQALPKSGGHAIRAPQVIQNADATHDQIVLENYDDQDYGYLRVVVTKTQLRIEYHLASDGDSTKAPDDSVTVGLASQKLAHYTANDLGHPEAAKLVNRARKSQSPK